jgi:c-di-GMP-binding flagellar brake protein YcgR
MKSVVTTERRRYKRFTATAFLKMPVLLSPVPPFFGKPIKGKMIDLSAGGLALLIDEVIPLNTKLNMKLSFPNNVAVNATVQVRRLVPRENKYLMGMEFIVISEESKEMIDRMSSDYIDCETRIAEKARDVCRAECAFMSMCTKAAKRPPAEDVRVALELAFQALS